MANIIEIMNPDVPELDVFYHLTEAQLRNRKEPEKGIFIAESPKVINSALDAGCRPVSLLMERKHIAGQGAQIIARCGDVPVYTADRDVLATLTGYTLTRGILCAMKRPKAAKLETVCANARRVAILEDIVDSTNIGAIFRSAAALHMDAVLITPSCADPLNRRAVRVSMGTVFQVPWAYIGSQERPWPKGGIALLREMGFRVAAMALREDALDIDDPRLAKEQKLAVVLGTEGTGLSQATIESCDYVARIPMAEGVDSLNVAGASAVAFWQLRVKK